MLRYTVHTTSSARDRNGNCYHYDTVTRVSDMKVISGRSDSDSNTVSYLRNAKVEWSEIHATNETVPIRQFDRLVKNVTTRIDREAIEELVAEEAELKLVQTPSREQILESALRGMVDAYCFNADWSKPDELVSQVRQAGIALGKVPV
jgi:hypothetical protein